MKILFVYDHKYPELWKDGLWAALHLLEKDGYEIDWLNLHDLKTKVQPYHLESFDFILGWGAFNSGVDRFLTTDTLIQNTKRGLCIGGTAMPPVSAGLYDVLFYETEWYLPQIMGHKNAVHAFGVNTDIYFPQPDVLPVWDWITVGAFSTWKRQEKLIEKEGYKFAIGEIQKENLPESMGIISELLNAGVGISDMVGAETLAKIYNATEKVYIPAEIHGGGERAVLEARACGRPVRVEFDNPKLQELLHTPVWDHFYYFEQLKKGINSCF